MADAGSSTTYFIGFREYILHITRQARFVGGAAPPYAHPVDKWIISALNATPVKAVTTKAVDTLVDWSFGYQLAESTAVDRRSFPDLFEILVRSADALDIATPHAVARHNEQLGLFNAFTAGTDDYAFISISTALCRFFTTEELHFIIGHECGHIAAGHVLYHTLAAILAGEIAARLGPLGPLLQLTLGVPLAAWSRRSEVTADRAGLICCGDIEIAERALLRVVTGMADVERVDIDDYLRRFRQVTEHHKLGQWQALFKNHPMIPRRIIALRLFAESELYYEVSGKSPPAGKRLLNRDDLNKRVSEIIAP